MAVALRSGARRRSTRARGSRIPMPTLLQRPDELAGDAATS